MLQQQKCLDTNQAPQYNNEQLRAAVANTQSKAVSSPQHAGTVPRPQEQQQPAFVLQKSAVAAWITASARECQRHVAATLAEQSNVQKCLTAANCWESSCKSTHNLTQYAAQRMHSAATLALRAESEQNLRAAQNQSQIAQSKPNSNSNDRNVHWHPTASSMLPQPNNMLIASKAAAMQQKMLVGEKMAGIVDTLPTDVDVLEPDVASVNVANVANTANNKAVAVSIAETMLRKERNNNCHNNKNNSSNNLLLQQNTEKTIDFNSRRRRGRLRRIAAVTAACSTSAACRLAHVASCAFTRLLLLSSLLLSLIVDYVNMLAGLVITKQLTTTTTQRHNITSSKNNSKQKHSNKSNSNQPATNNNTKSPYAYAAKQVVFCNASPAIEPLESATIVANAATTVPMNCNMAASANSRKSRPRRSKLWTLLAAISSNNMPLIYAFMLCTSILLPCDHNLVAAAKPKSATQLQQQKQQYQQQQLELQQQQQQQQQHQHQHQHQHHNQHQQPPQLHQPGGVNMAYDAVNGGILTPPSYQVVSSQTSNEETEFLYPSSQSEERFDEEELNLNDLDEEAENAAYETTSNITHLEQVNVTKTPLFPKDLFTKEQLQNGAVICHIIGVIYMFVALAIVCDEFFVPSLDVIIEKLDITDDVAGATFMAAGGSAPELFTSVIGVFISFDDVGIGTIVGSAVFNILFVIGMCALFSKTVLTLTWWPLFRDCSFYSISLLVLIYFFRDNFIFWWEALTLFSIYIAYVAFMKWNVQVERFVKKLITKNKGNAANSSETSMATQPGGSVTSRAASETRSGPPGSSSGAGATGNSSGTAGSTHTGAKFRHGLLQLMIHTIDPLHDGKVDEKATQLHAIASLKVLLDATKPQRGGATTSAANHVKINLKETTLADRPNGNIDTTLDSTNDIEEEPEPLSMAWPDTARKRLTYILVAPLLIPMWLTLPDTRTPRGKKYFPITFIGSIVWIAAFSYLMVWWANVAGDTAGIPPEVMGLTFLAAGTSIPDLITSVIVARKGFGDMAVSSSVGSNIFDVTVGLPIPWLLFGIFYGAPVEVNSVGMVCSITILFMMLIFVVLSIACFHWRMNKGLGFTMFLLYFVFVAVSLMFEYDMISCPV